MSSQGVRWTGLVQGSRLQGLKGSFLMNVESASSISTLQSAFSLVKSVRFIVAVEACKWEVYNE